jgi:hypothetical protein
MMTPPCTTLRFSVAERPPQLLHFSSFFSICPEPDMVTLMFWVTRVGLDASPSSLRVDEEHQHGRDDDEHRPVMRFWLPAAIRNIAPSVSGIWPRRG